MPFAVLGHFQRTSIHLLQDIERIILHCQRGCKILAAKVVDHRQMGCVVFDRGRGDDPAEGVVFLAEITWNLSIELLSRDGNRLIVEVDLEIDLILIII